MDIKSVLYKIRGLNNEERDKYLEREDVRNIIREDIFSEVEEEPWRCFRNILDYLSVAEFMNICPIVDIIKKFGDRSNSACTYYSAMADENINELIDYVLSSKDLLDEFIKRSDNFYSLFHRIDYERANKLFNKLLEFKDDKYKLQRYKDDLDSCFANMNADIQKRLIVECNDKDLLIYYVLHSSNEVINDFFLNDKRATYLFKYFNIPRLIDRGIVFNDNIIKKDEFFDALKELNPIDFRSCIDKFVVKHNPVYAEKLTEKYYDYVISKYNHESGMFREYDEFLTDPNLLKGKELRNILWEKDLLRRNEDGNLEYTDIDKAREYFCDITNKYITSAIIDAIFKDNIYNVIINLREMIRYNNTLPINGKILDYGRLDFYQYILNISEVDVPEKIALFHMLKDSDFYMDFYDDLRALKDSAYSNIKNNLFNCNNHPEYIDSEKSQELGVKVYDLRDKEYYMLVRSQEAYKDKFRLRRNSYSIISDENNTAFVMNNEESGVFLYGYNSFEEDRVFHMFESDSFSSDYDNKQGGTPTRVNRIMDARELVNSHFSYSEVQIVNTKSGDDAFYDAKKPDFIVAYEKITDAHVKESKRLNIPIVIITEKKFDKENSTGITFNEKKDQYVHSSSDLKFRK